MIGVGAVVFNERDEVLLIKRGKPPHYGRWMIPGGALEWGETLQAATVREVREETGIDVEIEVFVELIEAITPGPGGYHFVIIDYAAHAIGGTLKADSDALDAAWVEKDSLSERDLSDELLAVIEKARRVTRRLT
ncbi:MAG: NUDIX hydrolase [Vicinamibacteria bacterium]|nr:NUDIX hydrolase [Vicinamibacteria bacterium]